MLSLSLDTDATRALLGRPGQHLAQLEMPALSLQPLDTQLKQGTWQPTTTNNEAIAQLNNFINSHHTSRWRIKTGVALPAEATHELATTLTPKAWGPITPQQALNSLPTHSLPAPADQLYADIIPMQPTNKTPANTKIFAAPKNLIHQLQQLLAPLPTKLICITSYDQAQQFATPDFDTPNWQACWGLLQAMHHDR